MNNTQRFYHFHMYTKSSFLSNLFLRKHAEYRNVHQIISAQTVRNCLREAVLLARNPYRGHHLSAVGECSVSVVPGTVERCSLYKLRFLLYRAGGILKTSQLLHGMHTHRICHPLSRYGKLWIGCSSCQL